MPYCRDILLLPWRLHHNIVVTSVQIKIEYLAKFSLSLSIVVLPIFPPFLTLVFVHTLAGFPVSVSLVTHITINPYHSCPPVLACIYRETSIAHPSLLFTFSFLSQPIFITLYILQHNHSFSGVLHLYLKSLSFLWNDPFSFSIDFCSLTPVQLTLKSFS